MWNWSVTPESTRLYYERLHKNKTQNANTDNNSNNSKLIDKNTSTPKLHVLRYKGKSVDAVLINFPFLQLTSQRINALPVIMMIEISLIFFIWNPFISPHVAFTLREWHHEVLYKLQFLRLKNAQYTKF